MSYKCSLSKSPNGAFGGYSQESIDELYSNVEYAINTEFEKITDDTNSGQVTRAIRQAMHIIGDQYSMQQLNKIAEIVQDYIENNEGFMWLMEFYPQEGIKNAINPKYRKVQGENPSFLGEPEEAEAFTKKSQFIDDVWGTNVRLKNQFKQEATNTLINDFIIDREHGRIVKNARDANRNARERKNQLWREVKEYLMNQGYYHGDIDDIYNDEGYTGIFDDPNIQRALRVFGSWDADKIQRNRDSEDYQIFKKWFTLKHYDSLVDLMLGTAVLIKPGTNSTFTSDDNYSFAEKNDAVITSWRTTEDVVLEQEISKLAQSLVNSTPYYEWQNDAETGQYLKFADFYRVATKIKESVFNKKTAQIRYNTLNPVYSKIKDSLTETERNAVENKTLKDLICNIRENPNLYSRLVFEVLVNDESTLKELGFLDTDLNILYSMHKGIFATQGNSIAAIQDKEDYRAKNYYNLLTQVFDSINSVQFLQYNMDDGVVTTRLLKDYSAENVRRGVENNIAYINASHVVGPVFKEREGKFYKIGSLSDETNKFEGIQYIIPETGVTIEVRGLGTNIICRDKSGAIMTPKAIQDLLNDPKKSQALWQFFDDNLALGASYDVQLRKGIELYLKNNTVQSLINLTSNVLLNKYIANVKGADKRGKDVLEGLFREVYGENKNKPSYNSNLMEMGLYSDAFTPTLDAIAKAKTLASGVMQQATVKDADGKTLSQQTLSRLLGNLMPQYNWIQSYDWQGNGKHNPFEKCSLMQPGVFKGVYTTRELKSPFGNKPHTKFTVAEFTQGAFLYDFVDGFVDKNDVKGDIVIGNGVVGFLSSVNSDKNTINRIAIDLNAKVVSEDAYLDGKTYRELTSDETNQVIAEQLGTYFQNVNHNIQRDFNKLFNWLQSRTDLPSISSLESINELYSNPNAQLYQFVKDYNESHTDHIQLIDQTHYIYDKKTKRLRHNTLLNGLQERFSNPKALTKFMKWKQNEMLKSLLDENVEMRLVDGKGSKTKQYLIDNYKDWVHHGKMVLAKVNGQPIMNKSDLKAAGLDINNPHSWTIELHPMLQKYNALDYLFTSQYMYAGVGCHTNHPSKASYDIPIIYKHPKLGLSTFLEKHPSATKYMMDFDDYYNEKRNAFIEAKTGVEHYIDQIDDEGYVYTDVNPAWEAAKNQYLIEYEQDPDYQSLLVKSWNEAKTIAKEQNKMLFCSTNAILKQFPTDFKKAFVMSADEAVSRGMDADWKASVDESLNRLVVPKIEAKQGEYFDKMANSYLSKEFDQLLENELADEASRFTAQHKRNVSYTAAMHEFQLNQIDGIPTTYNMAIMDDLKSDVYTVQADVDKATNFDGATFVNPFVVIWENNSLNGDKAGLNKKQFVHFYDRATGTGGIIKTAGFGLTNDKIRQFDFYRTMMHNMTSRNWTNADGSQHIMRDGGILADFEGNHIDYGDFYYRKGSKFFKRRIQSYDGNNTYSVLDQEVDENGETIGDEKSLKIQTNSNYDVWQMFGGANSVDFLDGTLQGSENSIEMTSRAASLYGTKTTDGMARTAADVNQPMKHSDIHYMPTAGAVKQGAANMNPASAFFSKNGLSYMTVEMRQAGIQLDKEHQADNEDLSLMTQVISAACSMGYTQSEATHLYNALYNLTKQATKSFRDEMGNLIEGDKDVFDAAVTETIVKSLLNAADTDGDMLQIIAKNITKKIKETKQLSINKDNFRDLDAQIPYSDAAISAKIVSSLSSSLAKAGIKNRMPGLLAVLNPAEGIIKHYRVPVLDKSGNPVLDEAGNPKYKLVTLDAIEREYNTENAYETLRTLQEQTAPLTRFNVGQHGEILSAPDIKIGHKYICKFADGSSRVIQVTMPHRTESSITPTFYDNESYNEQTMGYRKFVDYLNGVVDENTGEVAQITEVRDFLIGGQDLDSYDVRFSDINGNAWQMSDLDIVQDYFEARESKDPRQKVLSILNKYGTGEEFQKQLIKEFQQSNNSNKEQIANALGSNFAGTFLTDAPMYKEFFQKYALKYLNREMQKQLASFDKNQEHYKQVLINDQWISIEPSSIDITNYGVVMPKTAAKAFGLNQYDQVSDILSNPNFFLNRVASKLNTKVQGYTIGDDFINNYHLELKRNDGNHIYIRRGLAGADLHDKVEWFKYTDSEGKIFRVDGDNKIMYQMYSTDDEIYKDLDGNEIIVTNAPDVYKDDKGNVVNNNDITTTTQGVSINSKTGEQVHWESPFTFYMDHMNYNFVNFNAYNASEADLLMLVNAAHASKNRKANSFAKHLTNLKNFDKQLDFLETLVKMDEVVTGDTKNSAYLAIQKEANRMWTSFVKYLDNVAARIPAQSMQSFMPQRVVAFENTDTNNAYVSKFQFFLQGSDLDIDAVSIQTFDINHNGIYESWSPYTDLSSPEQLKLSEQLLPFPSGVPVKQVHVSDYTNSSMFDLIMRQHNGGHKIFGMTNKLEGQDALFKVDWSVKTGKVSLEVNTESADNLHILGELLSYKTWEQEDSITPNVNALAKLLGDGVVLTENLYKQINDKIVEALNNHHLYLKNNSKAKNERILKNYAVTSLYNIIRNPINLREAQSSVDVMTSTAKGLTKSSVKNTVQKTFTPGNVINKIQSINENMVGKDGIAICATGLKSFYALTHMYNTIINNGDLEEANKLLFNVPIGGKVYHGLANANADIIEQIQESEKPNQVLEDYLLAQDWESDAANEMSAFLSLSTDNAKELALAKLNAGPETLGMYLYGLSLGIPVNTLFQVMTSPIAFRLTELAKGDLFNGNNGCHTILGALNYLHDFPTDKLSSFDLLDLKVINEDKSDREKLLPASTWVYQLVTAMPEGAVKSDINPFSFNKLAASPEILTKLEALRAKVDNIRPQFKSDDDFNLYKTSFDQILDFIKDYITDIQLMQNAGTYDTVHGRSLITSDIEMLAMGAEEMKLIGKILRLNQEIKTNALDLQHQVANIEECITRRLRLIGAATNRRQSEYQQKTGVVTTKNELKRPDQYKFGLEEFVTNPVYQAEKIAMYDRIKHSYNPLRILTTDPQYKGYLEMLYIAHKGLKNKQLKYNFTVTKVANFIEKNKVNQNLQQQVLRNANNFIDLSLRQDWMKSRNFKFTIPASTAKSKTYAFIGDMFRPKPLYFKKSIQLGTDVGDANFKLWVERTLIPKLKTDPTLKDNIFIQHLSPVVNTSTNIGLPSVYYGLNGVNMLPQSDAEREVLDMHKDGFNALSTYDLINDADGKGTTLQDILYMYSLICNNGKLGPNSLHKIFEDYLDSNIATSYKQFIAEKDKDGEYLTKLKDKCSDSVLAPIGNPWVGGSKILKYKDLNAEQMLLYTFDEKSDEEGDYPEGYDYGDYGIPDGYDGGPEGTIDNTLHINNYTRQDSTALNKRDYSFFSNISLDRTGLGSTAVLPATLEFTQKYPITYTTKDGHPVLVSVGGDSELAEKYAKLCKDRARQSGQLPTKLVQQKDGTFSQEINEQQINDELNSLINCG